MGEGLFAGSALCELATAPTHSSTTPTSPPGLTLTLCQAGRLGSTTRLRAARGRAVCPRVNIP